MKRIITTLLLMLVTTQLVAQLNVREFFEDRIILSGSGALTVPSGTTGERPSVPVNGMTRYNETSNELEGYINSSWQNVQGATSPLTTKGDIYTYDTGDQRLAVGSDDEIPVADSSAGVGLSYKEIASLEKTEVISVNDTLEVTGWHNISCDTSSGGVTLTLPSAVGNKGLTYRISKTSNSNDCVIDGDGAETISGKLTVTLQHLESSAILSSNGTSWDIYSRDQGIQTLSCTITNSGTPTTDTTSGVCQQWILSLTDHGPGDVGVNYISNTFSSQPNCIAVTVNANTNRGGNIDSYNGTTSVRVQTVQRPGTLIDADFTIMCQGRI